MTEPKAGSTRYQIGVDIGGTFTDVVVLGSDGRLHTRKTLSTPDDYGRGIVDGIGAALADLGIGPDSVERVVHATTVATNAILEHKGATVGLITTTGFRDVLEMRRLRIPEMYVLNYQRPEPLVPRRLRLEVNGRIGPKGQVWTPLDEESVREAARVLAQARVDAVAVSLLHSYVNPEHERRVAAILREVLPPDVFVTCSCDILPVIREYERTSTTVINAFLGPTLQRYFASLRRHLDDIGIDAPVQIMKSDGGLMSMETASEKPAYLIESGPAAGVIGAARLGALMRLPDNISFDMGGTTAKASMVEGGDVARTADYEVGAGINLSSKLVMGGGYALKLPVIDISEIGAGGGSLASIDEGGLLRVGPRSAGSMPGPVAYGMGGEEPTFADAVITLGYLNPDYLTGGQLRLDAPKARQALRERIADRLGGDLLQAAFGIYEVACGTMTRAVKAISTYRGRDPRDFSLYAFGGNGPVVAARLADMLEMKRVVIPPNPGVFSAFGLLMSTIEHEAAMSHMQALDELDEDELGARYRQLETDLAGMMAHEKQDAAGISYTWLADMRYVGQAHELTVAIPGRDGGRPDRPSMEQAFSDEHQRTYGHRAEGQAIECVTIRVIARVQAPSRQWGRVLDAGGGKAEQASMRQAYFGPEHGLIDTPVVTRAGLAQRRRGPLIVEEYDSTVVVPPGWSAWVQDFGAIHLESEH